MNPLIDPRLGLITAVRRQPRQPGVPPGWVGYGAHVAATDRYAAYTADRYGFGASLGDPDRAWRAAVGEAVERYCGNIVPDGLPISSYRELGEPAVDPATLALYSPQQYATAGFPFVPFDHDLRVAWVRGTDLQTGGDVLVPASLAYLNYYTGPRRTEPPTNALSYAGIATGTDRSHAERFALEEIFERDATTLWWAGEEPAPLVTDAGDLIARLDDPDAADRTVRIRSIPSAFGVPVVTAFLTDHREQVIAFGSACRADPREAATKALVEAIGLYAVTRKLLDPDSDVWHAVREGVLAGHVFRPYRADRSYRDAFRPDLRDLVDLPAIAQLYLDPRMQGEPLDRLRAEHPATTFDRIAAVPADRAREVYLSRLAAAGLRAVSVDLTTRDVAAAGLRVVRVLVPGLYGNSPPAFPLLGGDRLPAGPSRPPIPLA
ncbi:YcaO-like family protein [Actinoplanes sp. HUAS TT8]|uniref:YcaO-like family protein n=1 Tax=Actinoplanes sp. HUAS TT8 TaxID=3447453 RepID=UPI003F52887B